MKSLRDARRDPGRGDWVVLSAADPLNLVAVHSHRVAYLDGVAIANLAAGRIEWLAPADPVQQTRAKALLTAPVKRGGKPWRTQPATSFSPMRPVR
jgi:hypothetical protein